MNKFYKGGNVFIIAIFAAAIVAIILSISSPTQSEKNAISFYHDKNYVEGELIVMLKSNIDAHEFTSRYDNISLSIKEPVIAEDNVWLFQYDKTKSEPVDALLSVMASPDVAIVQFNHYVQERVTTPNDTRFNEMWDMNNTGQSGGTVDADIDAPEAWDFTTGGLTSEGDTIVVAVIDGGFYLNHTDMNFWKNWGEIPGNSIDDDSNGYVDDVNGWNAYNSNGNVTSSGTHGTHVSGTIGARGNNNSGVTGVSWNVRVMAVQGSSGVETTVLKAYRYVQRQRQLYNQTNGLKGAFVVSTNSSFGVDFGQPSNYPLWCAYYDSLGTEGILSAAAGPNINLNIDTQGDVPTACPSDFMIAVTNTTRNDIRNSGSGYGPINMDLGAPGTSILSTTSASNYGTSTGTSMATPHVAGTVGLMYAGAHPSLIALSKTNPGAVASMFKQIIMQNVDTLLGVGLDSTVAKGRLNLYKTMVAVNTLTNVSVNTGITPETYTLKQNYPNPFNPSTKIEFSIPVKGLTSLKIYDVTGKEVAELINGVLSPGLYTADFNAGNLSSGIYFYSLKSASGFVQTKKMMLIK